MSYRMIAKFGLGMIASNRMKICKCGHKNSYIESVFVRMFPGDREGDERGGSRGRGRDRDQGETKENRRQTAGNAWSKGRPRILSNSGPSQMKKYEEPQLPVSVLSFSVHTKPVPLSNGHP